MAQHAPEPGGFCATLAGLAFLWVVFREWDVVGRYLCTCMYHGSGMGTCVYILVEYVVSTCTCTHVGVCRVSREKYM